MRLALLVLLLALPVRAELAIKLGFDSAAIGQYQITDADDRVDLLLETDGTGFTYWTHFKVTGTLGRTVTFHIQNAGDVPFLAALPRDRQLVYSYDGETWLRIPNYSYAGGIYSFTQSFTEDAVFIATFFPFSSERMSDRVDAAATTPWATKTVLGQSHQGRDVDLLTITDPAVPDAGKQTIYIVSRQHAAESAASWSLDAMIEYLVSDDPTAAGMRAAFVWHLVPMVNPDGVFLGNSRANAVGEDPNRDWHPNNGDSPEIVAVRDHLIGVDVAHGIDLFIDWHHLMNQTGWYNYTFALAANGFFPLLAAYTEIDTQEITDPGCSVSSCNSLGFGESRGLFSFFFEPSPHIVDWTIPALRAEGVGTARAINEYFGGPGAGAVEGLTLQKQSGRIAFGWQPSCVASDGSYALYEGVLGDFSSHQPLSCDLPGLSTTLPTPTSDRYYLVVPQSSGREGSYGPGRGPGSTVCRPQALADCP